MRSLHASLDHPTPESFFECKLPSDSEEGPVPFRLQTSVFVLFLLCVGMGTNTAQNSPQISQSDIEQQAWVVLRSGLDNEHASRRTIAVEALSLVRGNRRAEQFAVSALQDHDFHVRGAAAGTLGQLHVTKAIPELRNALNDSEISVVLASAHSLYLLHDESAYDVY